MLVYDTVQPKNTLRARNIVASFKNNKDSYLLTEYHKKAVSNSLNRNDKKYEKCQKRISDDQK